MSDFWVVMLSIAAIFFIWRAMVASGRRTLAARRLRIGEHGLPATATVLSVRQFRQAQEKSRRYEFTSRVVPADAAIPPFEGTTRPYVDTSFAPGDLRGHTLPAHLDPENPKDFYLVGQEALRYPLQGI
jgi:hypothetical protein